MNTAIFTQKNICAALGLAMAFTIVLKAKAESNLVQQTARFENSKPTPQIGTNTDTNPETLQVNIYKIQEQDSSAS